MGEGRNVFVISRAWVTREKDLRGSWVGRWEPGTAHLPMAPAVPAHSSPLWLVGLASEAGAGVCGGFKEGGL